MRKLKRFLVSAAMAGTAAGVIAPVSVVASAVDVMAEESEYHVHITGGEGGRVESNVIDATVYEDSYEVFGKITGDQQLRLTAVPDEGYIFSGWDFENSLYFTDSIRFQPDITIDVENARGALIKAKAVFVKSEENIHLIQNATAHGTMSESAKAGDPVHIETGEPDWAREYRENPQPGVIYAGFNESYRIERVSDGADVTDELLESLYAKDFIMPDYDIRVFTGGMVSGITYVDKTDVVEDDIPIQWETALFSIEDPEEVTGGLTEAYEGQGVSLIERQDENEFYEIIRIEDNKDVTDELEWLSDNIFYMPDYDIKVNLVLWPGVYSEYGDSDPEEGSQTGENVAEASGEIPENANKVLSQITTSDGTVVDEADLTEGGNSESHADDKTAEENTVLSQTANVTSKAATTAVSQPAVKTSSTAGATKVASAGTVLSYAAETSAVSTPAAIRMNGASTATSVNTTPATGDSTGTTAWLIAAGASAAIAAVAIAVRLSRRHED